MLVSPKKLSAANEFIAFCTAHAGVIWKHQGYIFSAVKLRNNLPIHSDWPLCIETYSAGKKLVWNAFKYSIDTIFNNSIS